jgi:hypothetical protein
VRSKKPSGTSKPPKPRKYRFFLDRNLGGIELPKRLRNAGKEIVVHDDVYVPTERDPWIFYECGKKGLIVVTSDKLFMKSFPHMAAIALGRTTVFSFSNNNYNGSIRATAFIAATRAMDKLLREHEGEPFIATIGMKGTVELNVVNPRPTRKACELADWNSYATVCEAEKIEPEMPPQLRLKGI